jgi:SNF2 family DNA or RNA helicase
VTCDLTLESRYRRTKHDPAVNLQLPQKIDQVVLCPLTDLQKDVYKRLLELEDVKIMLTAEDPCPCGARDEDDKPYKRGNCCEQEWSKMIFKVGVLDDSGLTLDLMPASLLLLLTQYMTLFGKVANHLALLYPGEWRNWHRSHRFI